MMYWYGDTFDLSWLLMILAMFAFWAFVIWLVANEVRGGRGHVEQAEEILTQRFARGEIDAAEYRERLDTLAHTRQRAA